MSNIVTGIGKGVGAAVLGVGAGAVALVAAPIQGGNESGPVGAVTGFFKGLGLFVAGSLGGVLMGGATIIAGVINTPGAIVAFVKDDDLRGKEKIDLSAVDLLEKEEEDVYRNSRAQVLDEAPADAEYVPKESVKETKMYDALGVKSTATASQLKRAYYKLAQKHHPDKGGDKDQFQVIGEAYAVLSDSKTRKKYDEEGEAALSKANVDSQAVFAMMFGERKFEPYYGELTMAIKMRVEEDPSFADASAKQAEIARLQRVREEQCAKQLAMKLDTYDADPEAWCKERLTEVAELYQTNLGPQMCHAVGIMHEIIADNALGVKSKLAQLGFGGVDETMRQAGNVSRMLKAGKKMEKLKRKQGADEAPNADDHEAQQTSLFNMMALDIESTVGKAAKLCLQDTSITKEQRRTRAKALLKLGRILQAKVEPIKAGAVDLE